MKVNSYRFIRDSIDSIPKDWKLMALKDIGTFSKGKGISKDHLSATGLPCIRYGEIYTNHDVVIKQFKSFISEEIAEESQMIKKGDVLFAGSGETIEDIGKAVAYIGEERAYAGGDIIILSTTEEVQAEFLSFTLDTDIAKKQKRRLGQGQQVVHIYPSDLAQIKIPLPPLPEQRAIAACLSTWDNAIQELTELIAQKELRKKWLMQVLLTGKRRLKGFEGEWHFGRLKDKFTQVEDNNDGNNHTIMTISSKKGLISQKEKFDKVIAGESLKSYTLIKKFDFAYNKGNSDLYEMGCVYQLDEVESALVPFVYICFRPQVAIDSQFYKQWFLAHGLDRQLKRVITSGARGDGLLNVSKHDFFNLVVPYPELEEQTAIARILQSADNELSLLREKVARLKEQKMWLMQKLLTGQKRLKID